MVVYQGVDVNFFFLCQDGFVGKWFLVVLQSYVCIFVWKLGWNVLVKFLLY